MQMDSCTDILEINDHMKKSLKMLIELMDTKKRFQFLVITCMAIFQSLLETLAVFLIFPFMYLIMGDKSLLDNKWIRIMIDATGVDNTSQIIVLMSIMMIGLYVFKDAYGIIEKWVESKWMSNFHIKLATDVYSNFIYRTYDYYISSEAADINRAVIDDISRFYELVKALFDLFQRFFMTLFLIISIVTINPSLAIIGGSTVGICIYALNKFVQKKISRNGRVATDAMTKSISSVNQTSGMIKNILVNKKQKFFIDRFRMETKEVFYSRTSFDVLNEVPGKLVESICMTGIFLYLIILTMQGTQLNSMISQFAVFAMAIVKILPSVVVINGDINKVRYNYSALECITNNLKHYSEGTKEDKGEIKGLFEEIRLENISFSYSSSDKKIYQDLSFSIKAGSTIGFVGATGSGKTTLVDLIIGLHMPESGNVFVDGYDIFSNKESWGRQIGYIPQNIYLCNTSIKENVGYGENYIDEERVIKCLKDAQVYDFIQTMPEGINTIIGDNGVRLSGGQRQRIGIARALYNNPSLLVMDEATSALDPETEVAITDSIKKLAHKLTIIIIAHRKKTLEACDSVYRVENGKVILEN